MRVVLAPLALLALIYAVGAAKKEASKPISRRGAAVVGTAALLAAAGLLWRRRRLVLDGAAVSFLVVVVVAVAVSVWLQPSRALPLIAAGVVGLCVWWMTQDHRLTGGRPWRDVIAELRLGDAAARAIVETNPDAKPGAVKVRGGRVEVAVEHLGQVDVERVGQVLHAPHVELVPGAEMGRARVVVHDRAPAPELPLWDAIDARGARLWPGTQNSSGTIRFGEDAYGKVHVLPEVVNPEKAANVLVGGMTGAGKSNGLALMLCELAWQPHVAWVGLDPHRVELKPFGPRMSRVAKGPNECLEVLHWLVAEMDRRFDYLDANDLGEWRVGVDGPGILWVADELAALDFDKCKKPLARLTAEQRKVGLGCIAATQRPEGRGVIELRTRDNFQIRVAFGMNSREGTVMVLDHDEDKTFRPTEIPEDLQGAYVLRLRRSRMAGRCYIPSATGGVSKAEVQATVAAVAAASAHLRVNLEGV